MPNNEEAQRILPVGSNKAWTSMSSGKPTKLSSSQNLTTWSSEAVWVLTLVHDAILDRDLYQGAEKKTNNSEVTTHFVHCKWYKTQGNPFFFPKHG